MRSKILICTSLLAVVMLSAVAAQADTVNVGITTAGCFPGLLTCSYDPLFINPGSLTFAGVNNSPNALITTPPPVTVKLGSFTFGDGWPSGDINDVPFVALITFNDPDGAGPELAWANVDGKVNATFLGYNDSGWVTIDFNNIPQLITFDGGSFLLAVNDLKLVIPKNKDWGTDYVTGDWTGTISNVNVVPEPASLTLMGTGILGLAGYLRRRFFV